MSTKMDLMSQRLGRRFAGLGLGGLFFCACGSPPAQGIATGEFIPDEKLGGVQICKTTGDQLLAQFPEPASRGRDGDFATLRWTAMIVATDNTNAGMVSQNVFAWIDSSGLVAGFVVNPAGFPSTPVPCDQRDAPSQPPPGAGADEPQKI